MVLQEPLLLRPNPKTKVWGGEALSACLGLDFSDLGPIGEVWTLADREESSNEVLQGSFAGRLLRGLMLSERSALLGTSQASPSDTFPVMMKLLDSNRDLSVQVHPDRKSAERLGSGAEAKDEFWYILDARDGARVYLGLKPEVDAVTFAAKAATPDVVDLLQEFPVKRGDCLWVPAGTVHSIGGGITLVEVQQNSDTTYRIYDWGRKGLDGKPRTCHLEEALQAIDYESRAAGPVQGRPSNDGVNPRTLLVETDQFGVELLSVHAPLEHRTAGRAWIYLVLAGQGHLRADEVEGEWTLRRGETWLLPASLGHYRFEQPDGHFRLLRVEVRA